jgi:cytochrome b561
MMVRNTLTAWGWPAKALHWIAAAAILVLLVHGWWMTHMVARPERLVNYAWHSALGYDLLVLLVLRLLWRWLNLVPAQPADSMPWEKFAAQAGHIGLYVLMFAVSLTGWMVATTFRTPMTADLFGLQAPALVTNVERSMRNLIEGSHLLLAYVLAALIAIHILGALRHHFIKHNEVLRRMLAG